MTAPAAAVDSGRVLAKAVLRAGERLGLGRREVAGVLGASEATLSRMARAGRPLDPGSKEGELALLLVRLYRSLDALVGGDEAAVRRWMRADNHHLGGVPADRIGAVEGLVHVVQYLDAMRAKA